jgi:hypothetical protein
MPTPHATPTDTCHLFVDEAGGPELFDRKGRPIIGTNGCSRFFMLGMLEVDEPEPLATALTGLRAQMLSDSYFKTAYSFQPEKKKTALLFHAKDDLPEVRMKVFDMLRSFGKTLHFRAVVCDKQVIRAREQARRDASPGYRYNPDALYDELARALFGKFSRMADRYQLRVARRGNKERSAALRLALEHAENDFASNFGFSRGGMSRWHVTITNPRDTICLQAADYFLWALQRFYEPRVHPETDEVIHEDRYLNAMLPQVSQIYDLHFGPMQGTFFTPANPLTRTARFGPQIRKKKKPQV